MPDIRGHPDAGNASARTLQGPRASDKDSQLIADLVTVLHKEHDDVLARRQLLRLSEDSHRPEESKTEEVSAGGRDVSRTAAAASSAPPGNDDQQAVSVAASPASERDQKEHLAAQPLSGGAKPEDSSHAEAATTVGPKGEQSMRAPAPIELATYYNRAHSCGDLSALCLSGGGIRSAAFALGVMQGLARRQLLHRFDYLSTVSGGGYIGSWLTSWVHRSGYKAVLTALPSARAADSKSPLFHLSRYSNYLTPRAGLLSADTLTLVALYVRNLLLNWLIILPFILAAIIFIKIFAVLAWGPLYAVGDTPSARGLGGLLAIAVTVIGEALLDSLLQRPGWESKPSSGAIFWKAELLPLLIGAFLASIVAIKYYQIRGPDPPPWLDIAFYLSLTSALVYLLAWLLAFYFVRLSPTKKMRADNSPPPSALDTVADSAEWFHISWAGFCFTLSGAITGLALTGALWLFDELYINWLGLLAADWRVLLLVSFGVPLVMLSLFVGDLIYTGLTSHAPWGDGEREWLARASGTQNVAAAIWGAAFTLVLMGSLGVFQLSQFISHLISVAGGSAVLISLLGKASSTAAQVEERIKSWVEFSAQTALAIATPLFVVSMTALLSAGIDRVVLPGHGALVPADDWAQASRLVGWGAGLVAFGLFFSLFVDINRFSLHGTYRNRLVRAFLGASRAERNPNPFTGFDQHDNLHLQDIWPELPRSDGALPPQLLVVNMALNVVRTEELAWQERKAVSFTATARHVGTGALPWVNFSGEQKFGCFRPARFYAKARRKNAKGITLGTAMTLSGAVASPNMGYHSSSALSVLLTLFNVRLGGWYGNPGPAGAKSYELSGPRLAAWPLLCEALGLTDDDNRFVYLSDGGHFENLGLYEMLRRRCRYIVVSDAGCDPGFNFEDLGNAVRRALADFGIKIDFKSGLTIGPRQNPPVAGTYAAIADIIYPELPDQPGKLLYIKPSFHGREPPSTRSYAELHPEFPHESTLNQAFGESQFQAYRALGEYIVDQLTEVPLLADEGIEKFIEAAARGLDAATEAAKHGKATPNYSRNG